jgi:hypothetical protein
MLDMMLVEQARKNIEARQAEAQAALVNEEAARIAHQEQAAKDGAAMIAAQQRALAAKVEAHAVARAKARSARNHRDTLRSHREKVQNKLGFSRADLVEAQKQVQRHLPLDPDTFPNEIEIDAHRQRFCELDEAVRRIQARIAVEANELRAAESAEDAAQVELERLAGEEMRLRP